MLLAEGGSRTLVCAVRVLVAPDKFKGSIEAGEAAARIAAGWNSAWPGCSLDLRPVADGGDGTLSVVQAQTGAAKRESMVRDARGRRRAIVWLCDPSSRTAWIEIAQVVGLAGLEKAERDPLTATTGGLGDVVTLAAGSAETIYLCLGGSATNDAGCGMAAALGYLFLDRHGTPLDPLPCNFAAVERIQPPETLPSIEVIGLTDVRNGLLGPQGATFVYGPQKGASPSDVEKLEAGLAHIADIAARDLGAPDPATPGAGAAGGLGFGVMTFLRGSLRPGFETVAKLIGLAEAVAAADIVITGEGRIDGQTCEGKAPYGVARLARTAGKPVIALAGSIPLTKEDAAGFDVLVPITDEPMSLEHAMQNAGPLLERAAARTAMLIKLGHFL